MFKDIGDYQIGSWHYGVGGEIDKSELLTEANTIGVKHGMLALTDEDIEAFDAMFVAIKEGNAVGMMALKEVKPKPQLFTRGTELVMKLANTAVIGSLFVSPEHQGKGLAHGLIEVSTAAGFLAEADICTARSINPLCLKAFGDTGYSIAASPDSDGKFQMGITRSEWEARTALKAGGADHG